MHRSQPLVQIIPVSRGFRTVRQLVDLQARPVLWVPSTWGQQDAQQGLSSPLTQLLQASASPGPLGHGHVPFLRILEPIHNSCIQTLRGISICY